MFIFICRCWWLDKNSVFVWFVCLFYSFLLLLLMRCWMVWIWWCVCKFLICFWNCKKRWVFFLCMYFSILEWLSILLIKLLLCMKEMWWNWGKFMKCWWIFSILLFNVWLRVILLRFLFLSIEWWKEGLCLGFLFLLVIVFLVKRIGVILFLLNGFFLMLYCVMSIL